MSNKISLSKGKTIFIIDLILIPVFILVIYTGLKIHVVGNVQDHDIWSYWSHFHIIVSIVSLIIGGLHIKAHWGWYKGFVKRGLGKKSKITLALSILFLLLTITGVMLTLLVEGGNSILGLWHYRLGLVMIVLLIIHTIARLSLLENGLGKF